MPWLLALPAALLLPVLPWFPVLGPAIIHKVGLTPAIRTKFDRPGLALLPIVPWWSPWGRPQCCGSFLNGKQIILILRTLQRFWVQGLAGHVDVEILVTPESTVGEVLPSSNVVMLRHEKVAITYRGPQTHLQRQVSNWASHDATTIATFMHTSKCAFADVYAHSGLPAVNNNEGRDKVAHAQTDSAHLRSAP